MKYFKILSIPFIALVYILLLIFLPTEEEREVSVLKELKNRNILEKQLVGKWNHSDFPAGLENNRYYHLLSANANYTYRGSDNSKIYGSRWSVGLNDSILILIKDSHTTLRYKIKKIEPNHIVLHQIENDSLTRLIEWFRHPRTED
ncbi:hypothetical protein GYB22_12050 [bacterium]|nr:hypothetical protein [bacterium]